MIYHIERWSLRKQSLLHFGLMLITVLPALLLSGWFPLDSAWGYFAVIGVFLVVGAVLWTVLYFTFARLAPRTR